MTRFALIVLAVVLVLVPRALAHDDLSWPAQFVNAKGVPCCTLSAAYGDCLLVPREMAMGLRLGSVVTLEFPAGLRTVEINAIHIGQAPAICAPGCLFTDAGV